MSIAKLNVLLYKLIFTLIIIFSIISNANSNVMGPSEEELTVFRNQALRAHNNFRLKHQGTPDLELDADLNKFAEYHCLKIIITK